MEHSNRPKRFRKPAPDRCATLRVGLDPAPGPPPPSPPTRQRIPPPADDPPHDTADPQFGTELRLRLMTELPRFSRAITRACKRGDLAALRNSVHQLLGAVVYCDCRDLEQDLRELRAALESGNLHGIEASCRRAVHAIDTFVLPAG